MSSLRKAYITYFAKMESFNAQNPQLNRSLTESFRQAYDEERLNNAFQYQPDNQILPKFSVPLGKIQEVLFSTKDFNKYRILAKVSKGSSQLVPLACLNVWPTKSLHHALDTLLGIGRSTPDNKTGKAFVVRTPAPLGELLEIIPDDHIIKLQDSGTYSCKIEEGIRRTFVNWNGKPLGGDDDKKFEISISELKELIESHEMSISAPMTVQFMFHLYMLLDDFFGVCLPAYHRNTEYKGIPVTLRDLTDVTRIAHMSFKIVPTSEKGNPSQEGKETDTRVGEIAGAFARLLCSVREYPESYGLTHRTADELLGGPNSERTLYELGCMVQHCTKVYVTLTPQTEKVPHFGDVNVLRLRERKMQDPQRQKPIYQVDVTGFRSLSVIIQMIQKRKNCSKEDAILECTETMRRNWISAIERCLAKSKNEGKFAALVIPAIGMGVWDRKDLEDVSHKIYWGSLLQAIKDFNHYNPSESDKYIALINPCGKHQNESWEKLVNHPNVTHVQGKCIVSLAQDISDKLDEEFSVFLFNASDPDRTLGCNLTGQGSNVPYNGATSKGRYLEDPYPTTEENYAKGNVGVYLTTEYHARTLTKRAATHVFETQYSKK